MANRRPTAFGTGLIALDVVLSSEPDSAAHLWAGGTCGNVLAILSYLGWASFPVARFNGDIASKRVRDDLGRWGVSLEFADTSPQTSTPIVVQHLAAAPGRAHVPRYSLYCPNCGSNLPRYKAVHLAAARSLGEELRRADVFFMDRVSPASLAMARTCAESGGLVMFEPSGIGNESAFKEAISLSHIVKYSNDRLPGLATQVGPLPDLVVETLGEAGLRYRINTGKGRHATWTHLDAFRAPRPIDTAGAGDWCSAGILESLGRRGAVGLKAAQPEQIRTGIRFGQALAAWNCGFAGARGGMYAVTRNEFSTQVKSILSGAPHTTPSRRRPARDSVQISWTCGDGVHNVDQAVPITAR